MEANLLSHVKVLICLDLQLKFVHLFWFGWSLIFATSLTFKEGSAFTNYIFLQFSSSFLEEIANYVDPGLPFISLSKGLELNTLRTMSQIIPKALKNPRQPYVVLSGPSFALELMNKLPTGCLNCFRIYFAIAWSSKVIFLCLCSTGSGFKRPKDSKFRPATYGF